MINITKENTRNLYQSMCAGVLLGIYLPFCFIYTKAWLHPEEAFVVYINLYKEKWLEGAIFLLTFPGTLKMLLKHIKDKGEKQ